MPQALRTFCAILLMMASCGEKDPEERVIEIEDDPITGNACDPAPAYQEALPDSCALDTDYQPRQGGQTNGWAACISDDNTYHKIQESVSSIARVEAYESMGAILWKQGATPTNLMFHQAKLMLGNPEGLGSRLVRRYDVHYDPPTEGDCTDDAVAAAHPDYCVGPAILGPIVADALTDGAKGHNRIVNAAKIQAALQWFLYVSTVKEATTCTTKKKDCDSTWAYYSGGRERDAPIGLAGDIDALAAETHDRAYDGVLAVRCWRDLDSADSATDLDLRDQAIAQLDRAALRGMALLIRQRFLSLQCSTGDYQQAHLEALRILVPRFDRETRARSSDAADLLSAAIQKEAGEIDVAAAVAALDTWYPCP